jgi:4-amino-4-deoxychorismate lyase
MDFAAPGLHDRGLAYGDGVFETLRLAAGRLVFFHEHIARLRAGCRALGLPEPTLPMLRRAIDAAVASSGQTEAVVKLIYTAGAGQRGYQRTEPLAPSLAVLVSALPATPSDWTAQGLVVGVLPAAATVVPQLLGLKHLNRLPQVLARAAWPPAVDECLLRDEQNKILGGTQTNVCWLEGEHWFTPPIAGAAIAGTVRAQLLIHGGVTVAPLALGRLSLARAMVLCNAVRGVLPVGRIIWPSADSRGQPLAQALALAPAQALAARWQAMLQALNPPQKNPNLAAAIESTAWVASAVAEGFLTVPIHPQREALI